MTASPIPGISASGWTRAARATFLDVPLGAWLVGLVGSLLLLGPALGPGSLLNLDLVSVPDLPVPHGVWGLGPELPRRVPLGLLLAWLSRIIGGDAAVKSLMVVGLTVAFAGMYRFVRRPGVTAAAAGVLYAFGPFLLTRVAVGHLMILWTLALLPWALPDLFEPDRSLRRVFWWSTAIGVAGVYGGIVCGAVLLAGLIARRGARWLPVLGVFVLGQLPWLVPLLVVGRSGTTVDGSGFPTAASGFGGIGRLLAGQGFWNEYFQIGKDQGWVAAVLGFTLLGLALYGTAELPRPWRNPLVGLALTGLVLSVLVSLPGLDRPGTWFTGTLLGAPFRESQRFLVFFLVWLAPAAALGAGRLSRARRGALAGIIAALPLAAAIVLASPAWWGFNDQLRPAEFPSEWAQARAIVQADPGPLVAFPWYQYFTLKLADNRLVLNVVPFYFGGDVIISSNPNLTVDPKQERFDPREPFIAQMAEAATRGIPVSTGMAAMGVHWVTLQHDVDWERYTGVTDDPGFELVASGPSLDLYRVRDFPGMVTGLDGKEIPSTPVIEPYRQVDASPLARWAAPYEEGWLRGWAATSPDPQGLIRLPGGSGPVWYWPSLLVLAADAVTLSGIVWSVVTRPRRQAEAEGSPSATGSFDSI